MSLTYVIPDLHGRFDLLMKALRRIETRTPEGGNVVFLGDYIDRGPESADVVDRIMAGPPPNWNWNAIRGNHEDMMIEVGDPSHSDHGWWISNGGGTTKASYGGDDLRFERHVQWMAQLPRLHWDEHRVYTHAGVSENYELTDQPEDITQWYRYPLASDIGYKGMHVVHGHTPIGPERYKNRTNLDGGAYNSGKLWVGVFDDGIAGGPIDVGVVTMDMSDD